MVPALRRSPYQDDCCCYVLIFALAIPITCRYNVFLPPTHHYIIRFMNIFVTDPDPIASARVLPDKHIVKMPLETCQMLSIVASEKWGHGFGDLPKLDGTPYKTDKGAFRNHPCTVWANSFVLNWRWLITHGLALCLSLIHISETKRRR